MNINKSGSQLVGHHNQNILAYVACSDLKQQMRVRLE